MTPTRSGTRSAPSLPRRPRRSGRPGTGTTRAGDSLISRQPRPPAESRHRHHGGEPQGAKSQRIVEQDLDGLHEEGSRQQELDEAVHHTDGQGRHETTTHGDEEDREHLETHRPALRHDEELEQAECGGERHGDRHLGDGRGAPMRRVGGRSPRTGTPLTPMQGTPAAGTAVWRRCADRSASLFSLRWHYPAAPLRAPPPSGVVRFCASALRSASQPLVQELRRTRRPHTPPRVVPRGGAGRASGRSGVSGVWRRRRAPCGNCGSLPFSRSPARTDVQSPWRHRVPLTSDRDFNVLQICRIPGTLDRLGPRPEGGRPASREPRERRTDERQGRAEGTFSTNAGICARRRQRGPRDSTDVEKSSGQQRDDSLQNRFSGRPATGAALLYRCPPIESFLDRLLAQDPAPPSAPTASPPDPPRPRRAAARDGARATRPRPRRAPPRRWAPELRGSPFTSRSRARRES